MGTLVESEGVVKSSKRGRKPKSDSVKNSNDASAAVAALAADDDDTDSLSSICVCFPGDEVVISTMKGTVTRQRVDDISVQSRTATGVLVQAVDLLGDDRVMSVDVLPPMLSATEEAQRIKSTTRDSAIATAAAVDGDTTGGGEISSANKSGGAKGSKVRKSKKSVE